MKTTAKRASGLTAGQETAREESKEFDQPADASLPEERAKKWSGPNFTRMRFDWPKEEKVVIGRIHAAIRGKLGRDFKDLYEVMYEILAMVREQEMIDGEPVTDELGLPTWKRNPNGGYVEDFSKLTIIQAKNFLFQITTRLVAWGQLAGEAWTEAMFAKAAWEEAFSFHFDQPLTGTVEDRKAVGTTKAIEERYFALFLSAYSRRAEQLVSDMRLLGQRLKDYIDSMG